MLATAHIDAVTQINLSYSPGGVNVFLSNTWFLGPHKSAS